MSDPSSSETLQAPCEFRELTRKRFLEDMLGSARATGSPWKVLVMDKRAAEVISSCCRMHEIMDKGITLCEDIDLERTPMKDLDVVYFVAPTAVNAQAIMKDFENPRKIKYKDAHIFFLSPASEQLLNQLTKEPLFSHIQTLMDVNVDFLATESRFFHVGMKSALKKFYAFDSREVSRTLQRVAEQIMTFCSTMNEYPFVRFQAESKVATFLAKRVQQVMDHFVSSNDQFKPVYPRSTLLITDRTLDLLTPIIHEFTYQAMLHDVLSVSDDGKYEWSYVAGNNKSIDKTVIITEETDPLFVDLRHLHIAEVSERVTKGFKEFMQANNAAKFKSGDRNVSLKNISAIVQAMPEYQQKLQKYSLHIDMAKDCMKQFQQLQLERLATIEQDLSCGADASGNRVKPSSLLRSILDVLRSPELSAQSKIRILLVFCVVQGGLEDSVRDRLVDAGSLTFREQLMLRSIRRLLDLNREGNSKNKKDGRYRQHPEDEEVPYDLSRYVPGLKRALKELISDSLSLDDFPYVKEPPAGGDEMDEMLASSSASSGVSYRKRGANWNERGRKKESQKGRIFAFVCGGASHAEIRSVYELSNAHNRDIVLGSTNAWTPSSFLTGLTEIRDGAAGNLRDLQNEEDEGAAEEAAGGNNADDENFDNEDHFA